MRSGNSLVVIENGLLTTYSLDNKNCWEIGRKTRKENPDIALHSQTISRRHGSFRNIDGIWFYLDNYSTNGTCLNGRYILPGIRGNIKPMILKDGDVLLFGGGNKATINDKTVWAAYFEQRLPERMAIKNTKGTRKITIKDREKVIVVDNPSKGQIIENDGGIAIYMGNITYLFGEINLAY